MFDLISIVTGSCVIASLRLDAYALPKRRPQFLFCSGTSSIIIGRAIFYAHSAIDEGDASMFVASMSDFFS